MNRNIDKIITDYSLGLLSKSEVRVALEEINRESKRYLLSEGQKSLWALQRTYPKMVSYNLPICLTLQHPEVDALKYAMSYLMSAQPILASNVVEENGVAKFLMPVYSSIDIELVNLEAVSDSVLREHIREKVRIPFSLTSEPLIRGYVFTYNQQAIFLLVLHHIVFDGNSTDVLVNLLRESYQVFIHGNRMPTPEACMVQNDFVRAQQQFLSNLESRESIKNGLAKLEKLPPSLVLPFYDLPNKIDEMFGGNTYKVQLDNVLTQNIIDLCQSEKITRASLFLGLFKILLFKYSQQTDLIVGMPVSLREEIASKPSIGFMINMVAIRSTVDCELPTLDFIRHLQFEMLDAIQNAPPFPLLAKELLRSNGLETEESILTPVFNICFEYQDMLNTLYSDSRDFGLQRLAHQEGEYDIVLEVVESDDYVLNWKFRESKYKEWHIEQLADNFKTLLINFIGNKKATIKNLHYIPEKQIDFLLYGLNQSVRNYEKNITIIDLFLRQANQRKNAIAASCANEKITYCELDERSYSLACKLIAHGACVGEPIAICMERSLDMIVGLLGILRAGCAYVPIDPVYPKERLGYILSDSGSRIFLTQQRLGDIANEIIATENININTIFIDSTDTLLGGELRPQIKPQATDLAYIIYTSGSTGKPKGVMIPHGALLNFLFSMSEEPGCSASDTLLAVTTICFDIAALEIFLPLVTGAQCCLCEQDVVKDPQRLMSLIANIKPTIMQATPSTWRMLFLSGWTNSEGIKILCGGEAMPKSLKKDFEQSGSVVWNMFGPTETTIWSTITQLYQNKNATIGKPIANTKILILNSANELVPFGAIGELCIGGAGLAQGYLNRAELTREKFLDNPYEYGEKIYRTGDLVYWNRDGELEYIGRMDFQVKVRGHRVELEEIENVLIKHPGIRDCVLIAKEQSGSTRLIAFYTVNDVNDNRVVIPDMDLEVLVKASLPDYMFPSLYIAIDNIPLTPNGKVDRVALMQWPIESYLPNPVNDCTENIHESLTELNFRALKIEQSISRIWQEVLGVQRIVSDKGFFQHGGDSVLAVLLASRISETFDISFSITHCFKYPSVREICGYILNMQNQLEIHAKKESNNEHVEALYEGSIDSYKDSVAVIGLSCQVPGAANYHEFWQNLVDGKNCATNFHPEESYFERNENFVPVKMVVKDKNYFDAAFFGISNKNAGLMDPQFRSLLLNSWRAIEDAGYSTSDIPETSVFMSASNSYYQAILKNLGTLKSEDEYVAWLFAQGGSIPTMISYELGFTAASLFIHTNCSSSLSALSLACQNLMAGESQYALVGASTLLPWEQKGYFYGPGLNLSSDGQCRAFDDAADGLVGGEGTVVFLLKKAVDAIKDGDNIHAILRGVALNNDGNNKAGFYSPSVTGQMKVIDKLLKSTGINPETISYVEAHGTGTKIGDPIELDAISAVYRKYTDRRQYCAIGSLKPNIGHLDTAAGLAGCLKVILSLKSRILPPSINFIKPNTKIHFESSPFYVNTEKKSWVNGGELRRAAVSSFGIGGTNSHAIFEEYKKKVSSKSQNSRSIFPISAKTKEQAYQYLRAYQSQIERDFDLIDFKSLIYTAQIGRRHFNYRICVIADGLSELKGKISILLNDADAVSDIFEADTESTENSPNFLLDGSNKELLVELWIQQEQLSYLAEFWVRGGDFDWHKLYKGEKFHRVSLPTYPFMLSEYGPDPYTAFIHPMDSPNHSLNPPGVHYLHPLVHKNISDFMQQKFFSKFHGNEFFLRDHVIGGKKILPGVACLEMVREAFARSSKESTFFLRDVIWIRPVIVESTIELQVLLVPNSDGASFEIVSSENSIQPSVLYSQGRVVIQAASISVHSQKDISEIRARCSKSIHRDEFYKFVRNGGGEYGPGFQGIEMLYQNSIEALASVSLASLQDEPADSYYMHPGIMDIAFQITDSCILLENAESGYLPFFLQQLEIYRATPRKGFVHVQFSEGSASGGEDVHYDIDLLDESGNICISFRKFSARKSSLIDTATQEVFCLQENWMECSLDERVDGELGGGNVFFLLGVTQDIQRSLELELGDKASVINIDHHIKNANEIEQVTQSVGVIVQLMQSMVIDKPGYIKRVLLLGGGASTRLKLAPFVGLFRSINLEYPDIFCSVLDLTIVEEQAPHIVTLVLKELREQSGEVCVKFDASGTRFVRQLVANQSQILDQNNFPLLRQGGVYWIVGGGGKLGLLLANFFAQNFSGTIIISGRSDNEALIAKNNVNSVVGSIVYKKMDVSNPADVEIVVTEIVSEYGSISGIFHLAGVIHDSLMVNKTLQSINQVLKPKISGIHYLDWFTRSINLELFVVFSSTSGAFGNVGQCDYAAANTYLDTFTEQRNLNVEMGARFGRTIAIAWPLWQDGAMGNENPGEARVLLANGQSPLTTADGISVFEKLLAKSAAYQIVLYGDKKKLISHYIDQKPQRITTPVISHGSGVFASSREAVLELVIAAVAEQLEIDRADIDIDREFGAFGFDSISLTIMSNKLNRNYLAKDGGSGLIPTVFFEYKTIRSFADYLCKKYPGLCSEESHFNLVTKGISPVKPVETFAPRFSQTINASTANSASSNEKSTTESNDIAIVGMSARLPMARDIDEFWENLVVGKHCISEIPRERWDWREYYGDPSKETNKTNVKWGGFIDGVGNFDPLFFKLSPREAEGLDPHHRLIMSHIWWAIEDAGYAPGELSGTNTAIFVGMGGSGYSSILEEAGVAINGNSVLGTVASIAPSRMSHFLNLRGASEPIDTACSSALVAVHRAVMGIQCDDFDMALVGGVQTILTPHVHISFNKAGMLSQDGCCKTFSDRADGYVRGEGVGIVFLKRLQDAVSQGDDIYAVIKGSAENHGGRANTLTSPNPIAQKELILKAYERAGIDPTTIGYIEAHGTGTPLGDPIEINALKDAFTSMAERYNTNFTAEKTCGLGSVKTNIGHLELAAGIAGLIKVLLQIRHKTLVPSLHCDNLNPYIDLESSPFYVVKQTTPWAAKRDNNGLLPLRAGVSSFGFGGVNAHVVVEEYKESELFKNQANYKSNGYVIPISAKNEERLLAYAEKLKKFIEEKHEFFSLEENFDRLAYTYQIGRDSMAYRAAFVASSANDLLQQLSAYIKGETNENILTGQVKNSTQHSAHIKDSSISMLLANRDWVKLGLSWVNGTDVNWYNAYQGYRPKRLHAPGYPFQEKKYWVATSDHALNQQNGQAIRNLLCPILDTVSEDARIYSIKLDPQSFFLQDHQINHECVLPGVAYLELVISAFKQFSGVKFLVIKNLVWLKVLKVQHAIVLYVKFPLGTSTSGNFEIYSLDGAENPVIHCRGYLVAEHNREPDIELTDILSLQNALKDKISNEMCYDAFASHGLNYGPSFHAIESLQLGEGKALAKLRLPDCISNTDNQFILHPSILDGALQSTVALTLFGNHTLDSISLPFAFESFHLINPTGKIEWAVVSPAEKAAQSTVEKCNITLIDHEGAICLKIEGLSSRPYKSINKKGHSFLLKPQWIPKSLYKEQPGLLNKARLIVVVDNCLMPQSLIHKGQVISVAHDVFSRNLNLQSFVNEPLKIFNLIKEFISTSSRGEVLIQVAAREGSGEFLLNGYSAMLKTAGQENPHIFVQTVVFDASFSSQDVIKLLDDEVRQSMQNEILYKQHKRYIKSYAEIDLSEQEKVVASQPWKEGGVYLITGGMGKLGQIFANEIAVNSSNVKLILVGRSELNADITIKQERLSKLGAHTIYVSINLSDIESCRYLVKNIITEHGKLDGIIHCAGFISDNFIKNKPAAEFISVLQSKIDGLVNLDAVTSDLNLDFFAVFSSVVGETGSVGQIDYAYANGFMVDYVKAINQRSMFNQDKPKQGLAICLQWPFWQDGGMELRHEYLERLYRNTGILPLAKATGIELFYRAVASGSEQAIIYFGEESMLRTRFLRDTDDTFAISDAYSENENTAENINKREGDQAMKERFELWLSQLFSKVIKLPSDEIDINDSLDNYGIDSIMAMELTDELEKSFGSLPKTLFFEYQNISDLSDYLLDHYSERIFSLLGLATVNVSQTHHLGSAKAEFQSESNKANNLDRVTNTVSSVSSVPAPYDLFNTPLDIAILGISGCYPHASDLDQFWENLKTGKNCISEIPEERWRWQEFYSQDRTEFGRHFSKWGGFISEVDKFDPLFFNIAPREAIYMDPQERLFLEHTWKALEDAGLTRDSLGNKQSLGAHQFSQGREVGVYAGVMYSEYQLFGREETINGNPLSLGGIYASVANRVSYFLNVNGPSITLDTMCSSSLTTIHLACEDLRLRRTNIGIAGGVNLNIHPSKYQMLSAAQFISGNGHCESFGIGGDGYIPGEGIGVVVLKRLEDAVIDGDVIHAVIKASAINHGGKTNGFNVPNPVAQAAVVRQALQQSGYRAEQISYIEAHGTGTRLGDPIEIAGLSRAFVGYTSVDKCLIGSVKSNIGHCEAAAGIAGLTKVILQLRHRQIVPSLHSSELNPNIDFEHSPFEVNQQLREWHRPVVNGIESARLAGISSFGAGGSNAHMIVEEYFNTPVEEPVVDSAHKSIIVFSAKDEERLQLYLKSFVNFITSWDSMNGELPISRLAYTLQIGREPMEARVALVVGSKEELLSKIQQVLNGERGFDGGYSGLQSKNKDILSILAKDEDLSLTVKSWIEKKRYSRLAELWAKGLTIDWKLLYNNGYPQKMSLPCYPFVRDRYWALPMTNQVSMNTPKSVAVSEFKLEPSREQRQAAILTKSWKRTAVHNSVVELKGTLLLFGTSDTFNLQNQIFSSYHELNTIHLLHSIEKNGVVENNCYYCDFYSAESCRDIFSILNGVINNEGKINLMDLTSIDKNFDHILYVQSGKITLLQKLIERFRKNINLVLQFTYSLRSFGGSVITLQGAGIAGLYQLLAYEYPGIKSTTVDTDIDFIESSEILLKQIEGEFLAASIDASNEVIYRKGVRYLPTMVVSDQIRSENADSIGFDDQDVVIVTGGTRGIGAEIVQYLVGQGVKKLVILGREKLPLQSAWHSLSRLPSNGKVRVMQSLLEQGVHVHYECISLAQREEVDELISKTNSSMGPITAIFHCAGSVSENPAFFRKSITDIQNVCSPKQAGLVNLHLAAAKQPLKYFVLFSSASACMSSLAIGQSDYAMANAFMDFYAEHQFLKGDRYFRSIQWPMWRDTGMAKDTPMSLTYQKTGLLAHTNQEGLMLLERVLNSEQPVTLPCIVDTTLFTVDLLLKPTQLSHRNDLVSVESQSVPRSDIGDVIEYWLQDLLIQELGLDRKQIDAEKTLDEYGAESIVIAQLVQHMEKRVAHKLPPSLLFEYSSISALRDYFLVEHREAFNDSELPDGNRLVDYKLNASNDFGSASATQNQTAESVDSSGNGALDNFEATQNNESHQNFESLSTRSINEDEIAVVGIACRFPGADNHREFWDLLNKGVSAITNVPDDRWSSASGRLDVGGWLNGVNEFDPAFFNLKLSDAAIMDPQARVVLEEALNVIYDAGYTHKELSGEKIGVYLGARAQVVAGLEEILQAPNPILGLGQNYLAANISRFFNFRGPSAVIDTACSSGLMGMSFAIDGLVAKRIDMAMVGGVSLLLNSTAHDVFASRNILSRSGKFGIFDKNADGEVLGEGAGLVLIKRLSDAVKDGNHIYAVIKSLAVNSDGRTLGPGSPNLNAQKEVIREALSKSKKRPEEIGYIEISANGSALVDSLELKALSESYRLQDMAHPACRIGSVKPNVGHLLLSSGMAGFIRSVLSVYHKRIPPFLSAVDPFDHFDFSQSRIVFNRSSEEWIVNLGEKRTAAQSVFPDGGTNVHVIVEEFIAPEEYLGGRVSSVPPLLNKVPMPKKLDSVIKSNEESFAKDDLNKSPDTNNVTNKNKPVSLNKDSQQERGLKFFASRFGNRSIDVSAEQKVPDNQIKNIWGL